MSMKTLKQSTTLDLAKRYLWYITEGVKHPTLNDPAVILQESTPDHVDKLIQRGMIEWPSDDISPTKIVA